LWRNARIRRHLADDLEQANPTEVGPAAREQPQCAARRNLLPVGDRGLSPRGDRHQAVFRAFAANHQERLARADGTPREAYQLTRAKTGAIEQFEQGQIAEGRDLAARRAVLGRFAHALDTVRLEDARPRP